MIKYRGLFIIVIILLSFCEVKAKSEYYFKQLSLREGLSYPTVSAILYDSDGYLWIGTKSGLNRFDKYDIKSYFSDRIDSLSLPSNNIYFLIEDAYNNLWVGSDKLSVYDRENDCFNVMECNGEPVRVTASMLEDDGVVLGGYRLYKYDYSTRKIREIDFERKVKDQFSFIHPWKNGMWLLGTRWDGLWLYDKKSGSLSRWVIDDLKISAYYVDKDYNLWISPYGKGLKCISQDGHVIKEYTASNSDLSHDIILSIVERGNELWIATDGGGICIINKDNGEVNTIKHIAGDANSLPVNSIKCLYLDRDNNMWAGTIREGLLGIKKAYMRTYRSTTGGQYGLSENAVISIYEDSDSLIWIGTDGGGMNVINRNKNMFIHYIFEKAKKITSITEFNRNELLLSTFDEGLYTFNKRTGVFSPFIIKDQETNDRICRIGLNVYVYKYSNDSIFFLADSVYSYDVNTRKFTSVRYKFKRSYKNIINSLIRFAKSDNRLFLFSPFDLYMIDCKDNSMYLIFNTDGNMTINSAARDRNGVFWMGTDRGLVCFDPKVKSPEYVHTNLFHEVTSVFYDSKGRLWIGAQGMLFTYIIDRDRFIVWGESDGVVPNEYMPEAMIQSSNGDIFLGGMSGMLRIMSDVRLDDNVYPKIELSDVLLNGSSIFNHNDGNIYKLRIPWNYTSLTIKVNTTDKDIFRKKVFRFTINGRETSNVIESYDHTMSIHSLATGKYSISVSCNMQDGGWSAPVTIMELDVTPPWWRSVWFVFSMLVLFALIIMSVSMYMIRRKEIKMKWAMKEREEEIDKDKIRFLINISHELRTPLTLVYAPLKRLMDDNTLSDNLRKQLAGIFKQTRQMRNIINMVLDVRKMEVGRDKLYISSHDVNKWVEDVVMDFRNEFSSKGIEIVLEKDDSIGEMAFDDKKCEIVLSNLLMNALKFSYDNTKVIVRTETVNDGKSVRISVEDHGMGLGNIDSSQLFSRFSQGKHHIAGSGIGLSYAKMLVEMQGGTIGAYDNDDTGATFYFELPYARNDQVIECEKKPYINELFYSSEDTVPVSGHVDTSQYSVLVVEDEPDLRQYIADCLSDMFKKVYCAVNGREALDIIRQNTPDIVVSDVMMPQMNGWELCKSIKSNLEISHIPVILLTARADSDSVQLGYKLGADAYIEKPFDVNMLKTIICNQLYNREQMKQRYKNLSSVMSPEEMTFSNADEDFVMKLNKVINENISSGNLDVASVVDKMGMGRSALYSKVKKLTDMGVNEYIGKIRIERALQLLEHSDKTILEISEELGFNNQAYFSTTFKQFVGMSPSKYKEQVKEKNSNTNTENNRK